MFTFTIFNRKYYFCDKFGLAIQNYFFKVKFGTQTNLNMQHSIVMFFFLLQNGSFSDKFGPKSQNCQFNLKFGTQTNLNVQNSMTTFTDSEYVCPRLSGTKRNFYGTVMNCTIPLLFNVSFSKGPGDDYLQQVIIGRHVNDYFQLLWVSPILPSTQHLQMGQYEVEKS